MHGPLTDDNLMNFRTDIAFIGADGIDLNGNTFTDDLRVASLSRKMAANAAEVFVVTDSSKIGRVSNCTVLQRGQYKKIITNRELPQERQNALVHANIQLELC